MLLKKAVAISLIIVGVFSSIVIVWGLLFTKPLPRERIAAAGGVGSQAGGGAAVGSGIDTVNGAGGQPGSQAGNTPGGSSTGPSGIPGSSSGTSGSSSSAATGAVGGSAGVAPVLALSASPGTITAGGSSTLAWSINNGATSPITCTASGGTWSGAKATSGSQGVSPGSTTTYTLKCSNSAGSSTKSVAVTVNAAAPSYCGGNPNCYSLSQIQSHNSSGNCWGYTSKKTSGGFSAVFNINSLVSNGHGTKGISSGNFYSKCGQDITTCVNGSGGCGGSRNHSSGDLNNYSQSLVGYYDPAKP